VPVAACTRQRLPDMRGITGYRSCYGSTAEGPHGRGRRRSSLPRAHLAGGVATPAWTGQSPRRASGRSTTRSSRQLTGSRRLRGGGGAGDEPKFDIDSTRAGETGGNGRGSAHGPEGGGRKAERSAHGPERGREVSGGGRRERRVSKAPAGEAGKRAQTGSARSAARTRQ
jgi:hypothetical protein